MKRLHRKIRSLLFDKRAISVALSTIILTAGVIAFGITILYWAYSWGAVANQKYSDTVSASMSAIEERIAYEYITYSSVSGLTVNIINCGKSNNVSIARVYILNSTWEGTYSFPPLMLMNITNNQVIPNLNMTDDGYFNIPAQARPNIPALTLSPSSYYTIRVVTQRGRNFDTQFSTPP